MLVSYTKHEDISNAMAEHLALVVSNVKTLHQSGRTIVEIVMKHFQYHIPRWSVQPFLGSLQQDPDILRKLEVGPHQELSSCFPQDIPENPRPERHHRIVMWLRNSQG